VLRPLSGLIECVTSSSNMLGYATRKQLPLILLHLVEPSSETGAFDSTSSFERTPPLTFVSDSRNFKIQE
jgi:hypothetical protein